MNGNRILVAALVAVATGSLINLWMIDWAAGLGCSIVAVPLFVMTWRVA